MRFKQLIAASCVLAALQLPAQAQSLGLDVIYDKTVPTLEQALGYPAGSRISSPDAIEGYFKQLAQSYPDRVKLEYYGKSWEGRNLYYVVISNPTHIANFAEYQQGMKQLSAADSTKASTAQNLIKTLPASVWLSYGVHGNEISSPEAAMLTAYHLVAATDEATRSYLDNAMVFIDPVQNPDGRSRFVSRYYMTTGLEHSADRNSAEHNEPWPSGRSNHYLFDLNRDWLALTQPEISGQVDALLENMPLVFVDLHEMGGDTSYYFTPEADPYNPLITPKQRETLWAIGENNGRWFDQRGYDYFTREIFDAFYPGYGASWPLYHGSISMTYEMASARGHVFRTKDGEILTYGDGVQRHFVASMATIESVAQQRQQLLQNFWNYREQGIELGKESKKRVYLFSGQNDAAGTQRLSGLLTRHGVEVQQATEAFNVCGVDYPAGSFWVDSAQPAHYMVRTLLDQEIAMDDDFIAEQERRRANNLPDEIYDVTAWSLPLMFNLEYQTCNRVPRADSMVASRDLIKPGKVINKDAQVAYIVPWGDMNAGRFLTAALRAGNTVKRADMAFTHKSGQRYPAGSLVLTLAENPELASNIEQMAATTGATVIGVDSSWVTDGPSFGSNNTKRVHAPNIAMLWDEPVSSLNAGHTRFVLEQQFGYPVTAMRAKQLSAADLSHYQVLIVPSVYGKLDAAFGEQGNENITKWVERGGVLITLGNATQWAVEGDLLSSALERVISEDPQGHGTEKRVDGLVIESKEQLMHYITPDAADPYWTSGVLTNLDVDQEHWLSAGVKPNLVSITVGNQIYRPLSIEHGRNIVSYSEDVLASGYLWAENKKQLQYKPYLMWQPRQKGMVISFTQEPTYRAYLDGLNVLLLNAIFGGAAHATPLR
ncbi:M14 family metallopeptidase [Pseudidiomarina sp.]|uniref:M14 family metallopeptidase n=1 Tax=Pseudidiomarina sp. TaxID=2081707 RepID=UPI003A9830FB